MLPASIVWPTLTSAWRQQTQLNTGQQRRPSHGTSPTRFGHGAMVQAAMAFILHTAILLQGITRSV